MKLQSELTNAIKKLSALETQLEVTLLRVRRGEYGEGRHDDMDDIGYAIRKITLAREALEGRAQEYDCVFLPSVNSLECYQCGKSREEHK